MVEIVRISAARRGRTAGLCWLLLGIELFALSVLAYRQVIVTHPGSWQHTDEWIYQSAGTLVRQDPSDLYSAQLGEHGFAQLPFTYPPFAALLFAGPSSFSFGAWQIGLVVIDLVLLLVIIHAAL